MANFVSTSAGAEPTGISIDNNRRIFNFGDRVAELAPQQSPFFVYLSKVAKKATNDPVFKFLEQRHQWQRRNFQTDGAASGTITNAMVITSGVFAPAGGGGNVTLVVDCGYDSTGSVDAENPCNFIVPGAMLAIKTATGGVNGVVNIKLHDDCPISHSASETTITLFDDTPDTTYATVVGIPLTDSTNVTYADNAAGQVIGSSWGEATLSPTGWEDSLKDREGFCQIFKTACNIFSGTSMATEYRGVKNEFQRVWSEKLMEHKMDLEQAFLYGMGDMNSPTVDSSTRYTWGVLPYTEKYGKVYNMSYSSSGYDAFLDAMEDFFAPESGNSGNKLVLASRKVITYLNKLGAGSFLNNSVGSSQYRLDVKSIPGAFGHTVTVVNTIFGNLHFVAEPLLRGPWEDYCVAVDMKNVAYRPLVGNGVSRDTFIETNIQANDMDGRKDQIITEAGLEISLPETHAVLKFT